jgi:hypothetical protein
LLQQVDLSTQNITSSTRQETAVAKKTLALSDERDTTTTIRLTPNQRWAAEISSRIKGISLAKLLQNACDEAIDRHRRALLEEGERGAASLLIRAMKDKAAMPYERIIQLAELAPELLTVREARTIKLLKELNILNEEVVDGVCEAPDTVRYQFNPLVLRALWSEVEAVAATNSPSIAELKRLTALAADAVSV